MNPPSAPKLFGRTIDGWRVLLLSLVLASVVSNLSALNNLERVLDPSKAGSLGASLVPTEAADTYRIVNPRAASPLIVAGAREGDRVRFAHPGSGTDGSRPSSDPASSIALQSQSIA